MSNFQGVPLPELSNAQVSLEGLLTFSRAATAAPAAKRVVPHGPLADLMKADLLKAGTVLRFHQRRANRSGRAVVTPDGQLVVDGHATPFPSPSKAAEAVTGNVINGWTLWHVEDDGPGPTLDALRRELESRNAQ